MEKQATKRKACPDGNFATFLQHLFVLISFSTLAYGFDCARPIISPRAAVHFHNVAPNKISARSFTCRKAPLRAQPALSMKPMNDDDNMTIGKCRSRKSSIFQSLRTKWRKCPTEKLAPSKRDTWTKKKKRNVATIAAFLFAWVSPWTTKVSPPVANADTPPIFAPAAALLENLQSKSTETKARTVATGVLIVGAATTGGFIGQRVILRNKKNKKNKSPKNTKKREEEKFNEIMGNDIKLSTGEKDLFETERSSLQTAVDATRSTHEAQIRQTEKNLTLALEERDAAEERAKKAEIALAEATEWAKTEESARAQAEDLAQAGDEMHASLEALVQKLEKKARNEETARKAMEYKIAESDAELRDAMEQIEILQQQKATSLSSAQSMQDESTLLQQERNARIKAENQAKAAIKAKNIAEVIARKSEDSLQKAEATIRTTANHYRTLKEKSREYMDTAKSAEKRMQKAESKMRELQKSLCDERDGRRAAEERLASLQRQLDKNSSSSSSEQRSLSESIEEDLLRYDKFAELKNELENGWENGGYINMDRTSMEFEKAKQNDDSKNVQDEDNDKHGPQH